MRGRKTVAVVDDDKMITDLVARLLMRRSIQPIVCFRAEDALDVIAQRAPDGVVTDIFMEGMGGIEAIRRIREIEPQIKIIAISGGWGGSDKTRALRAAIRIGADAALAKPFSTEDFDNLCAALLDIPA